MKKYYIILTLIILVLSLMGCSSGLTANSVQPEIPVEIPTYDPQVWIPQSESDNKLAEITANNNAEIQTLKDTVDDLTNQLDTVQEDNEQLQNIINSQSEQIDKLSSGQNSHIEKETAFYNSMMVDYNNYVIGHSPSVAWDLFKGKEVPTDKTDLTENELELLRLWKAYIDGFGELNDH